MAQTAAAQRVMIVDGDAEYRASLADLLHAAGYAVTQAERGEQALELCLASPPRLVILEVELPGICGYEVCRSLRARPDPKPMIVFLSRERTESHDRVAGLIIGCDDYLAKSVASDELLARVRTLLRRAPPPAGVLASPLTFRERQVLELLAAAKSPREIAADLVISPKTVATHVEHILAKLDVHSRAEAVAVAYRDHLIER
jgi:DNA-binding NarL/FixJ family response regulator